MLSTSHAAMRKVQSITRRGAIHVSISTGATSCPNPGQGRSLLRHGANLQGRLGRLAPLAPVSALGGKGTPGRDLLSVIAAVRPSVHVHAIRMMTLHMQGEYDAAANANVWERRPIPVITRLITIVVELVKWHVSYPDDPPPPPGGIPGGSRTKRKARRAAAMRELLVRLGPAFVKIGQALSSRPDVLPPAYLVELEALQDRIPAFDSDEAFQVLEQELGVPLFTVFTEISEAPVAAASLGQVYRAVRSSDGQQVAVKVQRPGVAEAIALDVYILRWLSAVFRKLRKLNTDLPALVDEWASSLFRELDYRCEARNAAKFRDLYSDLDGVYVPEVYPDLTTAKVLTMEWVEGERLRTVADNLGPASSSSSRPSPSPEGMMNNRRMSGAQASTSQPSIGGSSQDLALVEIGVRCSLEQMLEHGFYHADPHPGNLLKTKDGRLAYLDFGMCGELDEKTSQALIRATLHLVNREYGQLAQDFIDLGLLPPGSDKNRIVPALTGVFQSALSRGVSNVSFGDLSGQLGRTMYQFSFRIPPYYTLLVRSLTVLEGIALASDPNYKVLGSAYPWIARRLLTNKTPELRETLRALLYTPQGTFRFSRLESLLQEAVRTPRGTAPSMTSTSSSRDGTALTLLLSPEASFVRDILLDELAKGIDAGWRVGTDTALYNVRHPLPLVSSVPLIGPLLVPLFQPFTAYAPHQQAAPAFSFVPWNPTGTFPPLGNPTDQAQQRLEDQELAGPVGALLAAIPSLSSPQDQEQLDGIRRLASAIAALATSRTNAAQAQPAAGSVPPLTVPGLPGLPEPSVVISQLQQAAEALRWLVDEISGLPQSHKAEALKLPAELASRLASRLTARTIRGLFGDESLASVPPPEEVVTSVMVVEVDEVIPPQPRRFGGNRRNDAVQDTLAGSSIV